MKCVVVIPALNPNEDIISYVDELLKGSIMQIIVIDDGSDEVCQHIFDELENFKSVVVLRHKQNKGKGAGLKTAFDYILSSDICTYSCGVVTADADGQHSAIDVLKIAKLLQNEKRNIIFGTRNFNSSDIPPKSKIGNNITSFIFKTLYGVKMEDTQTGLRGIPTTLLPDMLKIKGERYEYEMNMLTFCMQNNIEVIQEPIQTKYFSNNEGSHFRPIIDSVKVIFSLIKVFFKFILISLLSFVIDIALFTVLIKNILHAETANALLIATVLARICSSIFNFLANKIFVFEMTNLSTKKSFAKYFTLATIQLLCSWFLVFLFVRFLNHNSSVIKIFVDCVLFFISFKLQQLWVFRVKK